MNEQIPIDDSMAIQTRIGMECVEFMHGHDRYQFFGNDAAELMMHAVIMDGMVCVPLQEIAKYYVRH